MTARRPGRRPPWEPPAVLIACSDPKVPHPAPAIDLYTGSTFVLARRAALALTGGDPGGVWVVSAMHGVVPHDRILDPYDQRLGADCRSLLPTDDWVAAAINAAPVVIALLPARYRRLAAEAGIRIDRDLVADLPARGIGYQRQLFSALAQREVAWDA